MADQLRSIRVRMGLRLTAADRRQWPIWAPVLFGTGIGLYFQWTVEPDWRTAAVLASISLMSAWRVRGHWRRASLAMALISGGFSIGAERAASLDTSMLARETRPITITGTLRSQITKGGKQVIVLDDVRPMRPATIAIPTGVRVSFYPKKGADEATWRFRPGDRLRLTARLRPPPPPVLPGGYDLQRRSYFDRIGAYGFAIRPPDRLERPVQATWLEIAAHVIQNIRQETVSRLLRSGRDPPHAVAIALLTGERGYIPEPVLSTIRDAGIAHILAISGLHIGLIAGLIVALIRFAIAAIPWLGVRIDGKKLAAIIALPATLGYALMAGFTVPTERAFLMTSIMLLGVLLDRRAITLRNVAWAAMVVLALRPESLVEPGFQLSFAAVSALVAAYAWWRTRAEGSERSYGWRARIGRYVASVIFSTVIAGVCTAPLAIYHFQHVAAYGLLGNLFAIPLAAFWIMPAGLLVLITLPLGLETLPLMVMCAGIDLMLRGAELVAGLPGSALDIAMPGTWAMLCITLGGLWLLIWQSSIRLYGLVAIVAGWGGYFVPPAPPVLLIDDRARVIAVHDQDDGYIPTTSRRATFDVASWQQRIGILAIPPPIRFDGRQNRENIDCDLRGCIGTTGKVSFSILLARDAIEEDCARSDVIIALMPVRQACRAVVIDWFDVWRHGAHAVYSAERGERQRVRIETVNGLRGQRPWVVRRGAQNPRAD